MQGKRTPRRVKVERGIYYRETPRGRRYEIYYADSEGRQRWRVVPGNLAAARQARADVLARLGRGERVAPSRRTLAEVAAEWLDVQTHLRPRTRESYEAHLRVHVLPLLGRLRLSDVGEDDVARLIASMRAAGKGEWTIKGALTPLSRVLGYAARRGHIAQNPVRRLERGERPSPGRAPKRILDRDEIGRLLDAAAPRYRTLLATAVFTGLRQMELLGLRWTDVDLDAGLVRVRRQLDRSGALVEPKTAQARRDVVAMPALVRLLREHKLASRHSSPEDFVFASEAGTPLYYRNVSTRGLDRAFAQAGLPAPKPRFHDLRHTAASLLIAEGLNVVYVSRQLGHASPDITLRVYADLFDRAEHAERASAALEAGYGAML